MAERPKKAVFGGKRYCLCCSNFSGKVVDGRVVTLHRAPVKLRRVWERRLRLVRKEFAGLKENTRVCSEHFRNKRGPISGDDVPSVFPHRTFQTSTVSESEIQETATSTAQDQAQISEDGENNASTQNFQQANFSLPTTSVMLHDYIGPTDVSSFIQPDKCTVQCQTDRDLRDFAVQTDKVVWPVQRTTDKVAVTQTNSNDHQNQHIPLIYEHIAAKDEMVRVYTGLPNAATFNLLLEELPNIDESSVMTGRKCFLRPADQLLMTLMRLKLSLVLDDLSFRFGISKATCSKVVNKWIDHLYIHLSVLTYWPTREQINNTMPSDFKELFPRTRVVIDCTELFTETPQSLAEQSLMYSHYKTHMTWKALIGITPNGVVSFVSDLWAGSISDKQVVEKSGILDLCEKGDAIMGDKGFLISDLTTPRGIELIVPPKKNKDNQMSKMNTTLTRRIANCRIHVERHMERAKNFRILHNLTGTMKAKVSKIWHICNNLSALLPPLHPHDAENYLFTGNVEE